VNNDVVDAIRIGAGRKHGDCRHEPCSPWMLPIRKRKTRQSWVAREGQDVLESRIHSRCMVSSMHPDGASPWRVNPRKVLLSGALVFPDHPLIRIPQKN